MKSYVLSRDRGLALLNRTVGKVGYKLGAKPRCGANPGVDWKVSDCSGFVRWFVYGVTGGVIQLPQGSWYQRKWCEANLAPCDYGDCVSGDGHVRIAFLPARGKRPGHVWLVSSGQTIECYGKVGVGRRPWSAAVLRSAVDSCFMLGKWG